MKAMFKLFVLNEGGAFIRSRKIFSKHFICVCFLFIAGVFFPYNVKAQTANLPSRAIHVVYDDSGSMIISNNTYLDRWGQAKYAMEVFAAMLEEKDTMCVYYMSDFDATASGNIYASPGVEIKGSDPAGDRVAKIHDKITIAANTPFDPVVKAYNDFKTRNVDEKWLIVLTDGDFNRLNGERASNIDVDGMLSNYARESDVNINLLAIGNDSDLKRLLNTLNENHNIGYYVDHAENSNSILSKITTICNRIFNRNILPFDNINKHEFKFDLPMQQLLVFAQGEKVKVNGIKGSNSSSPSGTVNVRYSTTADNGQWKNDPNVIISTNLAGVIASFQNIPKGNYSLDVTDAQIVEIYYKPVVNVAIRLRQRGKEISPNDIREGKYKIEFGIVDENGKFFESSLLGNVKYIASIKNNGQTDTIAKSGNNVIVKEGDFSINVQAHFLDFNTAENTIEGSVLAPLTFQEWLIGLIRQFWYIFCLLAALLLYWLLWGTKKRFPKSSMAPSPIIKIEGSKNTRRGKFNIELHTVLLPFCAERGTISVVPAGSSKSVSLKVRAIDKHIMELANADTLTPEKLRGTKIKINSMPIASGVSKTLEINCISTIETTISGRDGNLEIYKCFLEKGQK